MLWADHLLNRIYVTLLSGIAIADAIRYRCFGSSQCDIAAFLGFLGSMVFINSHFAQLSSFG